MPDIVFLAPDTDAYVDSVLRHVAEYEEQSGDTVHPLILPSDVYFANEIGGYLEGEPGEHGAQPVDVFMSGPVLLWEHLGAGFRGTA